MKKMFCVILAVALLCGVLTVGASAAEDDYTGKTVILCTGNLRGDVDMYPKIAAAKKAYEAKGADVLLVDAGNYLQGSAAANSDMGLSVYNLMDAAGYDVAAMGLAEFGYTNATTGYLYHGNFTRYYTQKLLQEGTVEIAYTQDRAGEKRAVLPGKEPATFLTVASNVTAEMGIYSFSKTVVVETASGLKIGFYGLTDPAAAENVQDGFLTEITEPMPLSPVIVDADYRVCLSNAAGMKSDPGVKYGDIVFYASEGKKLVKAWVIDDETKMIYPEDVDLSGSDAAVAALAAAAKGNASPVVGTSEVILNGADSVGWNGETNLGDLATDALAWYAEKYIDGWNKSLPLVAIQNGGNCDNFIYSGEVTEVDLLRALPFSPMGVGVLEVTGAELLETLEAACQQVDCPGFAQVHGMKYEVDPREDYDGGAAYGNFFVADSVNRVTITDVGGAAFDAEATYALVADNYILNGNDTYYTLKNAKDAGAKYVNNGPGVRTRDIVALYIQKALGGVIGEAYAAPRGRITVGGLPFADVAPGDWYAAAVLWAAENGVADGASETAFAPKQDCPRGDIVRFLYRAAGSPAVTGELPFEDVDGGYRDAVLWAYQNGVAKGVDETHFAPDAPVSRAQAMIFLYRYAGAEAGTGENPFEDVEAGDYYDAILWAVARNITKGVDATRFDPDAPCTRGHIVTFLYRYAAL